MMGKRDDVDLDELTDEERAAIEEADKEETEAAGKSEDTDTDDDAAKAAAEKAAKAEKDEGEDGKDTDPDAKTKSETDDADAAKAKGADTDTGADGGGKKAADAPDKDEAAEAKSERAAPSPRWEAPEDAEAKLNEIETKKGDLADRFDNGDLTAREYQTELDKLNKEERTIERAQDRAAMAKDMRESTWFDQTVPAFLDAHPEYQNETLNGMLDTEVRRQQEAAAKEGKDPLSASILTKAHDEIRKAVSALTGEKPADTKKSDVKKQADDAAKAAGERKEPPKTLGKVPASDHEDPGDGGQFARLDRLAEQNPEAFEDALERLPEADRDRYLAAQ